MKYTNEISINRPIETVLQLFQNPENLKKWMKGLQTVEHLSGERGKVGAKALMKFKLGKREIEMLETILSNQLPENFTCTYETTGVFNLSKTTFIKETDRRTRYISEEEFKFSGFMKLIAIFMPGSFKKQSKKYQTDFKIFVESNSL